MTDDHVRLDAWLRGWLPEQRWYADKSRTIVGTRLIHSRPLGVGVSLAAIRVTFDDELTADYVVPYRVDDSFSDATASPQLLAWLGTMLSGTERWQDVVTRRQLVDPTVDIHRLWARPLAIEQSNTSIRYGQDWVVKLNRRLSYGPSPELELTPLLNRWRGDRCSPRSAAALEIRTDHGTATLAVLAEFVENEGDGWGTLLGLLRAEADSGLLSETGGRSLDEVSAMADLTADMHAALALDPWSTGLAPERITSEAATAWEVAADTSLSAAVALLAGSARSLADRSRRLAELVDGSLPQLRQRVGGFQALVGSRRTRVHGDYHLGQVLRTPEGRYVAIDFDGEPQRSLDERRAKYSPLRDVAGMMRSLSYAAGTVQAEREDIVDDAAFPTWERSARTRFLDAYLTRLAANGADLLPREPERIRQGLMALELEKAIYEVVYELNNRPEWVWIPLSQLVRMG